MAHVRTLSELTPRQEHILALLEAKGRISVVELARDLGVSEVTVRKNLQELEEQSFLKRVHGGAVLSHRSQYALSFLDKVGRLSVEKTRIGLAALELIKDGDSIILDAGTSTLALARLLPGRVRDLTVITNSLAILAELHTVGDYELIALGGTVRGHSLALIGPLTCAALARLHADRLFIGATGIAVPQGVSTHNIVESETKAAMIQACTERIVLADHTKVGTVSLAPFASWSDVDYLVTDRPLPTEFKLPLQSHDVQTIVAGDLEPQLRGGPSRQEKRA
jgi:DeoR/GlpR family transcriptional regulator of sugar metabolism